MKMAERRKNYRLNLQLPLEITSIDNKEHSSRISRNISAGGIYFAGPPNELFKPGNRLNIKIAIPKSHTTAHKNILNLSATVIRNEPISDNTNIPRIGVACKFDKPLTLTN